MEEKINETVEVQEEDTAVETEPANTEPRLRDAINASRPVKFIRRHKVGFGVGLGTAGAAIAAGVAAARGVFDGVTFDEVADAVADTVDAVAESSD